MFKHRWLTGFAALIIGFCAFGVAGTPASASLVISIPDTPTDPGTTASFDVFLTNPDAAAVEIGGFTIDFSVDPLSGMQFTNVATSPTSQPYIFAGTGAVDAGGFPFSFDTFPVPGFTASDIGLTVLSETLDPGETLSLGRVTFEVPGSALPGIVIPVTLGSVTAVTDELGSPLAFTINGGSITINGASAPVPEPSSLAIGTLLALVFVGPFWRRPKRA